MKYLFTIMAVGMCVLAPDVFAGGWRHTGDNIFNNEKLEQFNIEIRDNSIVVQDNIPDLLISATGIKKYANLTWWENLRKKFPNVTEIVVVAGILSKDQFNNAQLVFGNCKEIISGWKYSEDEEFDVNALKEFNIEVSEDSIVVQEDIKKLYLSAASADDYANLAWWENLRKKFPNVTEIGFMVAGFCKNQLDCMLMFFDDLEELDFTRPNPSMTNEATLSLIGSPKLGSLKKLTMDQMHNDKRWHLGANGRIGNDILKVIAGNVFLNSLEELSLSDSDVTDEGLEAIVASKCLPSLKKLSLNKSQISIDGFMAIVNSPMSENLEELCLSYGNATLTNVVRGNFSLESFKKTMDKMPKLNKFHVGAIILPDGCDEYLNNRGIEFWS
jgi:Leucine Rich Repeat (LRR) protein